MGTLNSVFPSRKLRLQEATSTPLLVQASSTPVLPTSSGSKAHLPKLTLSELRLLPWWGLQVVQMKRPERPITQCLRALLEGPVNSSPA